MITDEQIQILVKKAVENAPKSYTNGDNFTPHTWVIQAIKSAYQLGFEEGNSNPTVDRAIHSHLTGDN